MYRRARKPVLSFLCCFPFCRFSGVFCAFRVCSGYASAGGCRNFFLHRVLFFPQKKCAAEKSASFASEHVLRHISVPSADQYSFRRSTPYMFFCHVSAVQKKHSCERRRSRRFVRKRSAAVAADSDFEYSGSVFRIKDKSLFFYVTVSEDCGVVPLLPVQPTKIYPFRDGAGTANESPVL